jgi:hypothetical protein
MKQDTRAQAGAHPAPLALQTFVDHEATPADSLRLARHLSDCTSCDQLRRRLEALSADLSSLPGAEVPEGFSRQVMQRVANLPQPRRRSPLLRLVVPTAAAMVAAVAALANPWTVRLARGVGNWLPENPIGPSEVMDLLFAMGAAVLATLARAAANLGPWFAAPDVGPGAWFHLPAPMLILTAGLAAGLFGVALAGSGLWFLRTRKVSAGGATD